MKGKVFVVDDEEGLRYTFKRFLTSDGYEVTTAESYEMALEKLKEEEFDLIFADIVLGTNTGIDLLGYIKNKNITCPVVIVTGYPSMDTATEALRLGAFDYVIKPVRREVLLQIARVALRHKALYDEKEKYRSNMEAIFKSVEDCIITVDNDLNIVALNPAANDILSLSSGGAGKAFGNLIKDPGGIFTDTLKKTLKNKERIKVSRIEYNPYNLNQKVLTLITGPLVDNSGAVMVVRDETHVARLERELKERRTFHNITGKSEAMQEVYSMIEVLSDVPTTVLITGETGTGKELVAEALHYMGERKDKPLVKINCSALPENLLESELFGHVKGAFTGAIKDKKGRFEIADGGSIFLDEIGDITPAMQLRLLRVLQESEFERVGSVKPIKVNVRVITATNRDLKEKIKKGEFRQDLYYRLKVVELKLPPLRDRKEDIPLLMEHFRKKFNEKFKKDIKGFSVDVEKLFIEYSWPGNIRELEHILEHIFILSKQSVITVEGLPEDFRENISSLPVKEDFKDTPEAIMEALEKTDWNKSKAARILGISRQTIYRRIKEYGIEGN